jgi:hypothetical protein
MVKSSEFLNLGCVSVERIGVWKCVEVYPYFHSLPLKIVLCSGNVSLYLRYTGCNGKKYSNNYLCSYPLDSVN